MKRILPFFLTLLFLISCSTSEDPPAPVQPAAGKISIANDMLKAYEIVTLKVDGHALNSTEYELELGTVKVKAVKNADNSLTFLVPGNLSTGKYDLKTSFAENILSVNVLSAEPIVNPKTYVEEFYGNPDQDIEEYKAIAGATIVPAELVKAKADMEQAMQRFNSLSPEDQLVAAQVIKANEAFIMQAQQAIEEFRALQPMLNGRVSSPSLTAGVNSDCNTVCQVATTVIKVCGVLLLAKTSAAAAAGAAVLVGIDVGLSFITGKQSFMLSKTVEVVKVALDLIYWAPIFYARAVIDRLDKELTSGFDMRKADSGMKILKGETFTIQPKVTFRTLNASDVNSSSGLVRQMVSTYEKAKKFYSESLNSPAGPFPSYVSKTKTEVPKDLNEWKVKIESNSAVSVTNPSGTSSEFEVTFNTSSKEKLDFKFSIAYNNGVEESSKTYDATLMPNRPPHSIKLVDGDKQTPEPGKALAKPLQVVVQDINGKLLENEEVEWKITSGNGTLSNSKTKTNDKGIAEVYWTMHQSPDGEQKVEAIVKAWDGTVVAGAPVEFTTIAGSIVGKWNIDKIIEFNPDGSVDEEIYNKGYYQFNSDGTYKMVFEGSPRNGVYTFDKNKLELALTVIWDNGATSNYIYKVKLLTINNFIIEEKPDPEGYKAWECSKIN